ncbi:Kynurenine formamidase [Fagus crenata]
MNSLFLPTSFLLPSPTWQFTPCLQIQPQNLCRRGFHHYHGHSHLSRSLSFLLKSHHSLRAHKSSIGATIPPNEGAVSLINFEDFVEKDWSFLDSDNLISREELDRIISAGEIEETSKVLVSVGSEGFVDRLVDSSPCHLLLVVHDSLFLLAGIKEKYDKVKCWQGELMYLPEKWAPLDVVFLYFLPALPFKLDQVFGALAKRCLPGARVVISHPQGREVLKQQQQQYPDVIISDLPEKMTLQKSAADHSFDLAEFVDEPGFYLAVLKFSEASN